VLAIEYREDPTPVHALTASVSDAFVKPGETVDVTLTGSTPQYLASNVYLDKGTHTGMTFTGTSTTLKDGVVLTDRHDPNGDSGTPCSGTSSPGAPGASSTRSRPEPGTRSARSTSPRGRTTRGPTAWRPR
jgi:hypothetical protein